MVNIEYAESFSQVLDILEHMEKSLVNKIPNKIIEFLKNNASDKKIVNLDYSKSMKEMQLSPKAISVLSIIYLNYLASSQEKIEYIQELLENEKKYQEKQKIKYSYDNIFKNNYNQNSNNNVSNSDERNNKLVVYKKNNFFVKLIQKLKNILKM